MGEEFVAVDHLLAKEMINITKYAKIFKKKPTNFLDNPRIIKLMKPGDIEKTRGRSGGTLMHERHAMEFLLWLHPVTRELLSKGSTPTQVLDILDTYEA